MKVCREEGTASYTAWMADVSGIMNQRRVFGGAVCVLCVCVCDCMNAYVQVSVCTLLLKKWVGVHTCTCVTMCNWCVGVGV